MKHAARSFWNPISFAVFELFSVVCMFYTAADILFLVFQPEWNLPFLTLFCAIFGCIYEAGKITDQKKLSVWSCFAVLALSILIFRFQQIGWEILIACGSYALFQFLHSQDRLRQLFVVLIAAGLAGCFLTDREIPRMLIGAALFLILKELVSFYGREHGVRLAPCLLCLECLVFLIPLSDHPLDWSFVMRIGRHVTEFVQDMAMETEYLMTNLGLIDQWDTGYGNMDLLGGRLSDSDREELFLSSKDTKGNLYLTGRTFSTLDKTHWKNTDSSSQSRQSDSAIPLAGWYLTYLNTLYQQQVTPEMAACFSEVCATEITYGYLKTQDVIHPMNLLKIDNSAKKDMTDPKTDFTFQTSQKKGYHYRVTFMEFDYANPYLEQLLQTAEQMEDITWPSYETLETYSWEMYHLDLKQLVSKKEFTEYQAVSDSPDLEQWLTPEGITPRVEALAQKITENCRNDFEKCRAIEAYLRQYPYSKEVDYRNYTSFIDAFLFDLQTGYCTHYASAMVMMLRCCGIPARFTEGYCCNYNNLDEKKGYVLTGNRAHTWPEAYIRGYGWIRFEPTPSAASAQEEGWGLLLDTDTETGLLDQRVPSVDPKVSSEPLPPAEASESEEKSRSWIAVLCFLAAIPVIYLIFLLTLYPYIRRRTYQKKTDKEKMETDLRDVRWLIEQIHPGNWENRPLMDYPQALAEPIQQQQLEQICLLYYRIRYAGGKPQEKDWRTLKKLKQELYEQYLDMEEKGKWSRKLWAFFQLT